MILLNDPRKGGGGGGIRGAEKDRGKGRRVEPGKGEGRQKEWGRGKGRFINILLHRFRMQNK